MKNASLVTAGLSLVVLFAGLGEELHDERESMRKLATDPAVTKEAFFTALHGAVLRHPAEPYFPYLGALRAASPPQDRTEVVTAWVARTLERSPVHGPVHLVLARALYARIPSQARVEYRLAGTQEPALAETLFEAAPLIRSYEDAVEIVPKGTARGDVAHGLAGLVRKRLPATSWRLDELVLQEPAIEGTIRAMRAKTLLADAVSHETFCEDQKDVCVRRAREEIDRVIALYPTKCEGYADRVDLEIAMGLKEGAFRDFLKEIDRVEDRSLCLMRAIERAQMTKAKEEMALIDQLARAGCTTIAECTQNLVAAAAYEANAGRSTRAFAFLKTAMEKDPSNDELAERAAGHAAGLGLHREAADLFKRLSDRYPDRADLREAKAREERAVATSTVHIPLRP